MIKAARDGDAEAISALWNQMIRTSLSTFTTREKTIVEISELIALRAGAFWVWHDAEGNTRGFVTYGPFRSGPGYCHTVEHSIVVHPRLRGRGAAGDLMQCAMGAAAVSGHRIMVAGISSANPGAIRFHAKLGFAKVGHLPQVGHKHGTWLDLILMQRFLDG